MTRRKAVVDNDLYVNMSLRELLLAIGKRDRCLNGLVLNGVYEASPGPLKY